MDRQNFFGESINENLIYSGLWLVPQWIPVNLPMQLKRFHHQTLKNHVVPCHCTAGFLNHQTVFRILEPGLRFAFPRGVLNLVKAFLFQWLAVAVLVFLGPHFALAADNFDTSTPAGCLAILEGATIRPFEGFVLNYVDEPHRAKLGEGIMGGVATRVTDPETGRSWVEKSFFKTSFFLNDKWAMELLVEAFALSPHEHFRLVDYLGVDVDSEIMKLEWVPGETVHDKMSDWNNVTQREQQIALLSLYDEYLNYFVHAVDTWLATTDRDIKVMTRLVRPRARVFYSLEYEVEPGLVKIVTLGVRDENVVIRDQPRQLVLIDPY